MSETTTELEAIDYLDELEFAHRVKALKTALAEGPVAEAVEDVMDFLSELSQDGQGVLWCAEERLLVNEYDAVEAGDEDPPEHAVPLHCPSGHWLSLEPAASALAERDLAPVLIEDLGAWTSRVRDGQVPDGEAELGALLELIKLLLEDLLPTDPAQKLAQTLVTPLEGCISEPDPTASKRTRKKAEQAAKTKRKETPPWLLCELTLTLVRSRVDTSDAAALFEDEEGRAVLRPEWVELAADWVDARGREPYGARAERAIRLLAEAPLPLAKTRKVMCCLIRASLNAPTGASVSLGGKVQTRLSAGRSEAACRAFLRRFKDAAQAAEVAATEAGKDKSAVRAEVLKALGRALDGDADSDSLPTTADDLRAFFNERLHGSDFGLGKLPETFAAHPIVFTRHSHFWLAFEATFPPRTFFDDPGWISDGRKIVEVHSMNPTRMVYSDGWYLPPTHHHPCTHTHFYGGMAPRLYADYLVHYSLARGFEEEEWGEKPYNTVERVYRDLHDPRPGKGHYGIGINSWVRQPDKIDWSRPSPKVYRAVGRNLPALADRFRARLLERAASLTRHTDSTLRRIGYRLLSWSRPLRVLPHILPGLQDTDSEVSELVLDFVEGACWGLPTKTGRAKTLWCETQERSPLTGLDPTARDLVRRLKRNGQETDSDAEKERAARAHVDDLTSLRARLGGQIKHPFVKDGSPLFQAQTAALRYLTEGPVPDGEDVFLFAIRHPDPQLHAWAWRILAGSPPKRSKRNERPYPKAREHLWELKYWLGDLRARQRFLKALCLRLEDSWGRRYFYQDPALGGRRHPALDHAIEFKDFKEDEHQGAYVDLGLLAWAGRHDATREGVSRVLAAIVRGETSPAGDEHSLGIANAPPQDARVLAVRFLADLLAPPDFVRETVTVLDSDEDRDDDLVAEVEHFMKLEAQGEVLAEQFRGLAAMEAAVEGASRRRRQRLEAIKEKYVEKTALQNEHVTAALREETQGLVLQRHLLALSDGHLESVLQAAPELIDRIVQEDGYGPMSPSDAAVVLRDWLTRPVVVEKRGVEPENPRLFAATSAILSRLHDRTGRLQVPGEKLLELLSKAAESPDYKQSRRLRAMACTLLEYHLETKDAKTREVSALLLEAFALDQIAVGEPVCKRVLGALARFYDDDDDERRSALRSRFERRWEPLFENRREQEARDEDEKYKEQAWPDFARTQRLAPFSALLTLSTRGDLREAAVAFRTAQMRRLRTHAGRLLLEGRGRLFVGQRHLFHYQVQWSLYGGSVSLSAKGWEKFLEDKKAYAQSLECYLDRGAAHVDQIATLLRDPTAQLTLLDLKADGCELLEELLDSAQCYEERRGILLETERTLSIPFGDRGDLAVWFDLRRSVQRDLHLRDAEKRKVTRHPLFAMLAEDEGATWASWGELARVEGISTKQVAPIKDVITVLSTIKKVLAYPDTFSDIVDKVEDVTILISAARGLESMVRAAGAGSSLRVAGRLVTILERRTKILKDVSKLKSKGTFRPVAKSGLKGLGVVLTVATTALSLLEIHQDPSKKLDTKTLLGTGRMAVTVITTLTRFKSGALPFVGTAMGLGESAYGFEEAVEARDTCQPWEYDAAQAQVYKEALSYAGFQLKVVGEGLTMTVFGAAIGAPIAFVGTAIVMAATVWDLYDMAFGDTQMEMIAEWLGYELA